VKGGGGGGGGGGGRRGALPNSFDDSLKTSVTKRFVCLSFLLNGYESLYLESTRLSCNFLFICHVIILE